MDLGFHTWGARIVFWCLFIPICLGLGYIAKAIGISLSFAADEDGGLVFWFVICPIAVLPAGFVALTIDKRKIFRGKEKLQEQPDENH